MFRQRCNPAILKCERLASAQSIGQHVLKAFWWANGLIRAE
jgi:hypothetical protein